MVYRDVFLLTASTSYIVPQTIHIITERISNDYAVLKLSGQLNHTIAQNNQELSRTQLHTIATKIKPKVTVERGRSGELVYIDIWFVDEFDNIDFTDNQSVCYEIFGDYSVLGFGTGDPKPEHNYNETICNSYHGHVQLIAKSNYKGAKGNVIFTLESNEKINVEI